MSYVRFGSDSDVYVFRHVGGWFSCNVVGGKSSARCESASEVVSWLDEQRSLGRRVPDRAYDRLIREMGEGKSCARFEEKCGEDTKHEVDE